MNWPRGFAPDYFEGGQRQPDREVTVTCDGPIELVEPLRCTLSFEAFRGSPPPPRAARPASREPPTS
jgi:hypothetical protein